MSEEQASRLTFPAKDLVGRYELLMGTPEGGKVFDQLIKELENTEFIGIMPEISERVFHAGGENISLPNLMKQALNEGEVETFVEGAFEFMRRRTQ